MDIRKLVENYLIISGSDGICNIGLECGCWKPALFMCNEPLKEQCKIAIKRKYDAESETCSRCSKDCKKSKLSFCLIPKED